MEDNVQQQPRKRTIVIDCTDREFAMIKVASIYTDTKISKLVKTILMKWAERNQNPPPDAPDKELSL